MAHRVPTINHCPTTTTTPAACLRSRPQPPLPSEAGMSPNGQWPAKWLNPASLTDVATAVIDYGRVSAGWGLAARMGCRPSRAGGVVLCRGRRVLCALRAGLAVPGSQGT